MMDPELMRLAQEQISRMPPEDLAKIQQQVMSNPDLVKLATEGMKNLRPEDVRHAAEQLKHIRAEDMAEISEKISKDKPEEIVAMKARADAQVSCELNVAEMLKKQGNELHSQSRFHDAANKYMLAKNNLKGITGSKCRTLLLQCSLNLMSCYLKTKQYEACIKEGSEVLGYDSNNVKALYRRGQAHKELGNLKAAVSDLREALKASPDDETIANVIRYMRDVEEKLSESGDEIVPPQGLVNEEINEAENNSMPLNNHTNSNKIYSVKQPVENGECYQKAYGSDLGASNPEAEYFQSMRKNPEAFRAFQNCISNADPDTLAALGAGNMSPDMIKAASDMMSKMKHEELQQMFQFAASMNGKDPRTNDDSTGFGPNISQITPEIPVLGGGNMSPDMIKTATEMMSKMKPQELQQMFHFAVALKGKNPRTNNDSIAFGPNIPQITPEMTKMASDMICKLPPEELQKILKFGSSMDANNMPFAAPATVHNNQKSESISQTSIASESPLLSNPENGKGSSHECIVTSQSVSSFPTSIADIQDSMGNSLNNPAMQQMLMSMMKNMSPEMMANMSEQFGMKLSKEDAAKAQQAMSSLSPDDLDRMMRWAERAQRVVETSRKTKNWLVGRPGMILAICMLILAFIFHQLGFIGG